jgi:hypothetical protein
VHKRRRPPCPITPATLDKDWIPEVASRGWLIVTRDRNIQDHRAEIGAVRDHSARMVTLHGPEARGTWEQLEIFMSRWRDIERQGVSRGSFDRLGKTCRTRTHGRRTC